MESTIVGNAETKINHIIINDFRTEEKALPINYYCMYCLKKMEGNGWIFKCPNCKKQNIYK